MLHSNSPLLLASNHPNSFLDAIIYDILFDVPIWSLARGDAFKSPKTAKILHKLKIFPVYRMRDGVENLSENYETFDACIKVFKAGEGVLIFSEGLCKNEWHLRPLRKGTARLAFKAWHDGVPLKVIPAAINYSHFKGYAAKIDINFGAPIIAEDFNLHATDGIKNKAFNDKLYAALNEGVYEIPAIDKKMAKQKFNIKNHYFLQVLLFVPALIFKIIHYPFYIFSRVIEKKVTSDTDHTGSVIFGASLLFYPLYILLITLTCWLIFKDAKVLLTPVVFIILALCYTKRKAIIGIT